MLTCCFRTIKLSGDLCVVNIDRIMTKYFPLLAAVLTAGPVVPPGQTPGLVGTWILTKAEKLLPDGYRGQDPSENPHGLVIFTADGYYSVQIYRSDRLKFSSLDRLSETPEEYKEASFTTSVHFGRYSMDPVKHTITFHIDRSSFPNLDGSTQVRPYEMKGNELSWKVAPRPDGSIPITVLRRVGGTEPPIYGDCGKRLCTASATGEIHRLLWRIASRTAVRFENSLLLRWLQIGFCPSGIMSIALARSA